MRCFCRPARVVAPVLIALAACEPWVPEDFPVSVDLADSLSEEQREAAVAACETWNSAVAADALRAMEGNDRRIQRGRIQIHGGKPRARELATTEANSWHCEIAAGGLGFDPATLVHELGHCLGLSHDQLKGSIMGEYAAPGQRLLPEHVRYVRGLIGLPAQQ